MKLAFAFIVTNLVESIVKYMSGWWCLWESSGNPIHSLEFSFKGVTSKGFYRKSITNCRRLIQTERSLEHKH